MKAGGRKDRYAVHDLKTNRIVFQGVVLDEKGAAVGFDESADTDANLHFAQEVPTNSSGSPTTSPTSRASLTTAGIPPRTATTSSSISSSTSSTPSMATSTAKAASS